MQYIHADKEGANEAKLRYLAEQKKEAVEEAVEEPEEVVAPGKRAPKREAAEEKEAGKGVCSSGKRAKKQGEKAKVKEWKREMPPKIEEPAVRKSSRAASLPGTAPANPLASTLSRAHKSFEKETTQMLLEVLGTATPPNALLFVLGCGLSDLKWHS